MCMEEMKTIGAVEMTLGLLDLSLVLIVHDIQTPFWKALPIVIFVSVMTVCMGLFLICGGRTPEYTCVRLNTTLQVSLVLLSGTAFGFLVRFVPFRLREFKKNDGSMVYFDHITTLLIDRILIVLIVSFLLGAFLSLCLSVIGWCVMMDLTSQGQVPESSATTEHLCVEMNPGTNQDQDDPGLNQDLATNGLKQH